MDNEVFFDVGDFEGRATKVLMPGKGVVLFEIGCENLPADQISKVLRKVKREVDQVGKGVIGDDCFTIVAPRGFAKISTYSDEQLKDLGLQRIPG